MPEYTAKRARTRGRLLAAAQEMLPGAVRRGLEHAVGPGPTTVRARLSRQTWYRYWRADDSGFLDELTRTALDAVHLLLAPMLGQIPETPGAEPPEQLRELARAHLALVTHRRVAFLQLLVATLAVEDQFLEAETGTRTTGAPDVLHDHHDRIVGTLVGVYGPVLAAWGRAPRAPLDEVDVVAHVCALADGFALRWAADPDASLPARFAEAVEALVLALTEPAAPRARSVSTGHTALNVHSGPADTAQHRPGARGGR